MSKDLIHELKATLDYLDYAYSDLYSASQELPDYDRNSSSRDYMNQAEWYLREAINGLERAIDERPRAQGDEA